MKFSIILALTLFSGSAFAAYNSSCGKNNQGTAIKTVCLNYTKDSKSLVTLKLVNGQKLVLKEVSSRRSGYQSQEFGDVTYKLHMRGLNAQGELVGASSLVDIRTQWEYSAGFTTVSGKAPSGLVFSAIVGDTYGN